MVVSQNQWCIGRSTDFLALIIFYTAGHEKKIDCCVLHINLTSRSEIEMDLTRVLDEITWADVVIEQDELKSIQEFSVKDLKHKDLCTVCSLLKIKGVKNTSKESMLEKIVSVNNLK